MKSSFVLALIEAFNDAYSKRKTSNPSLSILKKLIEDSIHNHSQIKSEIKTDIKGHSFIEIKHNDISYRILNRKKEKRHPDDIPLFSFLSDSKKKPTRGVIYYSGKNTLETLSLYYPEKHSTVELDVNLISTRVTPSN